MERVLTQLMEAFFRRGTSSEIPFSYLLLENKLAQFGGIKQPFIMLINFVGHEFGHDIADIFFCLWSTLSGALNRRLLCLGGKGSRGGWGGVLKLGTGISWVLSQSGGCGVGLPLGLFAKAAIGGLFRTPGLPHSTMTGLQIQASWETKSQTEALAVNEGQPKCKGRGYGVYILMGEGQGSEKAHDRKYCCGHFCKRQPTTDLKDE